MTSTDSRSWQGPMVFLVCGSLVVLLATGLRTSFGLFLKPMSTHFGWGREVFAFAMALQNLLWGVFQPFVGAVADKWGSGRVVASGGLAYALGLYLMSETSSPYTLLLSGGLTIALGLSGAGMAVILGIVGRAVRPEQRSWALGMVTATASLGQLSVVPMGQTFINHYGWSTALQLLGLVGLTMVPLAGLLSGHKDENTHGIRKQSLNEALTEARKHRGFWFLTAGFFVCGFHVTFIAVHLPAYITDNGMTAGLGVMALGVIGLFNVFGSITWGVLGGRLSKKSLLSCLYLLRSVTFFIFIIVPVSTGSVLVFSATIGFLWLGTVPLTSGLVAQIFGPRYMTMLFGIVFFSHQVGSFIGVWLGGFLFDATGSYIIVWWLSVGLGLLAAGLHIPINEEPLPALVIGNQ